MLGNVYAAHDLEARDDGALQFGGDRKHAAQKTVDTHTHDHFAVLRLQVDIARALGKRAFNEAVERIVGALSPESIASCETCTGTMSGVEEPASRFISSMTPAVPSLP